MGWEGDIGQKLLECGRGENKLLTIHSKAKQNTVEYNNSENKIDFPVYHLIHYVTSCKVSMLVNFTTSPLVNVILIAYGDLMP